MIELKDLQPGQTEWTTLEVDAGIDLPLSVDVFLARGDELTPLALLTAGVHGDEYEGPDALAAVARRLAQEDLAGSAVVLPVVNPLAFAAAQRLARLTARTSPVASLVFVTAPQPSVSHTQSSTTSYAHPLTS